MALDSVCSNTFKHDMLGSGYAKSVLFLGLYLLFEESQPSVTWLLEELRREREFFDRCQELAKKSRDAAAPPPPDPDASLSPEAIAQKRLDDEAIAKAVEGEERLRKALEDQKTRRFDPSEGEPPPRLYTPEEIATHERWKRLTADLHAKYHEGTTQYGFHRYDAPVSPEELASHSIESYLVRGYQLMLIWKRPLDMTPKSWGPMTPEDVERLKTVFDKLYKITKQKLDYGHTAASDLGDATAVTYATLLQRVEFFGRDPYGRFPDRTVKVFTERCFEDRFLVVETPRLKAATTREIVLRRWAELVGTPFDDISAPEGEAVFDDDYPEPMKRSVAEGFLPGDLWRTHDSAVHEGFVLPPLGK